MTLKRLLAAAALAGGCAAGVGAAAQTPQLGFPVDCRLGQTCEIQNYVDRDPAVGAVKDYRGGVLTYDKHTGTDIRIPDLAAQARGVDVLAAADGKVLNVRDGLPDVAVRNAAQAEAINSQGCGNAVGISHAGGYSTYYCHMARGSVRVKTGDTVKAGQPIGRIGVSGLSEYPHLHFMVRREGKLLDPFDPGGGQPLWRSMPTYKPRAVLNTGFRSSGGVTMEQVESGRTEALTTAAPVLVAYVRSIGLKAGDHEELTLRAPGGGVLATNRSAPLPRNRAQQMIFAGAKRPAQGWPEGAYTASYKVVSGGKVVLEQQFRANL